MEIEKIKNSIVCDFLGCGNLADYKISNGEADGKINGFHVCRSCAKKLHVALSGLAEVKSGKDKLKNV